jgi:hypothetical protein
MRDQCFKLFEVDLCGKSVYGIACDGRSDRAP